jgi:hypothetical protein
MLLTNWFNDNASLTGIREVTDSNFGSSTHSSEVFVVFLSPPGQIQGYYFKLGHKRFLSLPFQLLFNNHRNFRQYRPTVLN